MRGVVLVVLLAGCAEAVRPTLDCEELHAKLAEARRRLAAAQEAAIQAEAQGREAVESADRAFQDAARKEKLARAAVRGCPLE